ncbi:uncharacterized protein LOC128390685 [Panonychus citri]|uniref:uncharacterized protein LOC128390685 n=1 Tax=Panonychus citri TaxID=50023 RepID=UPI002307E215|nr:uncharacterized protein LOC128390685 [Panonychus citri]
MDNKMLKLLIVGLIVIILPSYTLSASTIKSSSSSSSLSSSLSSNLRSNPIKDARDLTWMLVQEYARFLSSLIETVQKLENTIKKRTYSYGLEVVGRPIDQLSPGEMLLSAALMPRKFYSKATDNFVRKVSNVQKTINVGLDAVDKARKTSNVIYQLLQTVQRSG